MKKTLVFLYPIKEYLRMIDLDLETYDKFFKIFELRYRAKGYNIFFVMFPDKEIAIPIHPTDHIILTDVKFSNHIIKDENGKYPYPNPDFIFEQLPRSDEYVICGFHAADCVERVAKSFYENGMNTLIDIDLTDLFYGSIQSPYFNEENYNLATHIEWLKGKELAFSKEINMGKMIEQNYSKPYYKLKEFIPEITAEQVATQILTEYLKKQEEYSSKRK